MNHQQVHEIPKSSFQVGDHFIRGKYYRNGMGNGKIRRYNLAMLK